MSGIARSIRRASARRAGAKWPERNSGQLIKGSVVGNTAGARCFDREAVLGDVSIPNIYAKEVLVFFRHPTKKRTAGRACRGKFVQPYTMIVNRYGLGAIQNG